MKRLVTAVAVMGTAVAAYGDGYHFSKHHITGWGERDKPEQVIADCTFLHFQSKYCMCVAKYFPFDMTCYAEFLFVARGKEEDILNTPRPKDHKPYTLLMIRDAQTVDMMCTDRGNYAN